MLTQKDIVNISPKDKKFLVSDSDNLFVLVYPSGKKSFVFDYKDPKTRKLKRITLGQFPQISIKEARDKKNEIKILLKTNESIREKEECNISFRKIAEQYFLQRNDITKRTLNESIKRMENHCYPIIGDIPISNLKRSDILNVLEKIKLQKKSEVGKKIFTTLDSILTYAVNKEMIENNVMLGIKRKDLVYNKKTRHFATITETSKVKELIENIIYVQCDTNTKMAILLSLLTAQRSFSIRSAAWEDIDLENGLWNIPASKMKMKKAHYIHLSDIAVRLLKEYKQISHHNFLFKSIRTKKKGDALNEILSDNTVRMVFRRMGYSNEDFTPHGFRSMFSTLAHENIQKHQFSSNIIEMCLAHTEKNKVKASYNFAQNLKERKGLMQWYSDYLCEICPKLKDFILLDFI
ncbi:TPA: tyrosine-type recombinase/integrase [Campylobacter jejuni]|nr:tyrosine-type recombinase/integrase [Campylobacter jejuni]